MTPGTDQIAWRKKTHRMLHRAGWQPNRNVLQHVMLPPSLPIFLAAAKVLAEFGNLRFDDKVEHLCLDPSAGEEIADQIRTHEQALGHRLFPLGFFEHQDRLYLLIDENGIVYTFDHGLKPFASSFNQALECLLHGLTLPPETWRPWQKQLLLFAAVGLFIMTWGGYYLYRAATAGPLVEAAAQDLEAGKTVESDYLRVRGSPRWDLGVRGSGPDSHRLIVPIVSPQWTTSRPAAAFLEILDRDGPLDRRRLQDSVTGTRVIARGFAHGIRERLERLGVRQTAHPILLNANTLPATIARQACVFIALGLPPHPDRHHDLHPDAPVRGQSTRAAASPEPRATGRPSVPQPPRTNLGAAP